MAIDVHQRFLRNAEQGQRPRIADSGHVAIQGEGGLDARARSEPARKCLNGRCEPTIGQLNGILQEGQGPYLGADLPRDVLNFVNQTVVFLVFDLETGDAQLKAGNQLAGRVMQILPQSPAFVVQSAQQLVHADLLRRISRIR